MYQALYRKYRPENFDDVYGQDVIIKTFKNTIKKEKLSHAYLFSGPRGTGKTSIAKIIGKTINCLKLNNGNPCNKCVNCTQTNNKENSDIIEIDAASNNGVDEIRELKSKINLVPSTGKYKIYIVDEVHMLTVGAFNALLKTLEEPPAHIIFILATTDPHKVPATILSRCQQFDFKKIPLKDIVKRLEIICNEEKINTEKGVLNEIARLSDGGLRDSISLLDQVASYSEEEITSKDIHDMHGTIGIDELSKITNSLIKKDLATVFNLMDEYNNGGKNVIKITEDLILFFRNLLVFKSIKDYFDDKEMYEDISSKVSDKELLEIIENFNETLYKMKNTNNPKLLFELTVIKLLGNNKKTTPEKTVKTEKKPESPQKKEVQKIENPKIKPIHKNDNIDEELLKKIAQIKQVRINNALSDFKKKTLLEIKDQIDIIRPFILTPEYNEFASLLLDGEIKAASDEYIIFVYEKDWVSNYFNQSLVILEKIFNEAYEKKFKLISTDSDNWEIIKKEFNSKKKVYEYIKETIKLEELQSDEENTTEIEKEFGDIVEYC
jgi:DNA polymerase III, subunit gamma and tau